MDNARPMAVILSDAIDELGRMRDVEAPLLARIAELEKALECVISVVGLTAFKHETQRAVLQEAVDLATRALRAGGAT